MLKTATGCDDNLPPKILQKIIGMKAVEKKLISEKQLTECLNDQDFFAPEKKLEEILLEKGYLTPLQIQRLKQEISGEREDFDSL